MSLHLYDPAVGTDWRVWYDARQLYGSEVATLLDGDVEF